MEKKQHKFLNKPVRVTKADGFVLYGTLIDTEQFGIWLKTQQETSFISYNNIKDIRLNEGGY